MWISSARPGVTLSRLSFVVVSLSFIMLFWNYGLPQYSPTSRFSRPGEIAASPISAPFFVPDTSSDSYATTTGYPESATETSAPEEINPPSLSPVGVAPVESSTTSCFDAKGAGDVMVILKTSAVEIYEKLPEHLLTLFRCTPHYAIFSDLKGVVAGQNIYDALENVTAKTREQQGEFEYYKKIQQYGAEWQQLADLKGEGTKTLDKWKFLPMVYKSYKMRPQAKFFVFIEADTSLSWTNLLQWINRLDPRIPYYAGSPGSVGDIRFAQRGGGFLLSNAAAKLYATTYEQKYLSKWENMTAGECCGDVALALGLNDAHVEFYSAFPLLQGETPASLDWTKRHWCAPVVSWHHMSPNEIDILWSFQQAWVNRNGWDTPYLIKNAFEEFVAPRLSPDREYWDNLSQDQIITKPTDDDSISDGADWYKLSDLDKNSTASFENCKYACEQYKDCVQYRYKTSECSFGKVIRLGRRAYGDSLGYRSGWIMDRIKNLTDSWEPCSEPNWNFNQ